MCAMLAKGQNSLNHSLVAGYFFLQYLSVEGVSLPMLQICVLEMNLIPILYSSLGKNTEPVDLQKCHIFYHTHSHTQLELKWCPCS